MCDLTFLGIRGSGFQIPCGDTIHKSYMEGAIVSHANKYQQGQTSLGACHHGKGLDLPLEKQPCGRDHD